MESRRRFGGELEGSRVPAAKTVRLVSLLALAAICGSASTYDEQEDHPGRAALGKYRELRDTEYWHATKGKARVVVILGTGCPADATFTDEQVKRQQANPGDHGAAESTDGKLQRPDKLDWKWKCDYKLAYSAVFRRSLDGIRSLGWRSFYVVEFGSQEQDELAKNADVIIAPLIEYESTLKAQYPYHNFIIIHTDDTATVRQGLDLNRRNIVGCLMHTSYKDPDEQNEPAPYSRRHAAWMLPEMNTSMASTWERSPPFTEHVLRTKIHTIIPQIQRWIYPDDCGGSEGDVIFQQHAFGQDSTWSPPLVTRPVDIAFAGVIGARTAIHKAMSNIQNGTIVYKKTTRQKIGSRDHRISAMNAVKTLGRKHNLTVVVYDHRLEREAYVDLLRSAKMFVSPFGLGEFSGKDYESLLAGSMLVKPLAYKLRSYPDIYRPDMVLQTQADFSDLEKVVMPFLKDKHHLRQHGQQMVQRAQSKMQLQTDPARFAADFDAVLEQLLFESPVLGDI